MSYTVTVGYDDATHRYFVVKSEIPGLNVETDTFEELVEVTKDFVPDAIKYRDDITIKFEREIVLAA